MKKLPFLVISALIFSFGCEQQNQSKEENVIKTEPIEGADTTQIEEATVRLEEAWSTDTTLNTPESVLFYPEDSTLYVSNVAGQDPTAQDKNGFISKITLDGEVEKLKWATGLDAPKGMAILNNSLYVTDINELVKIDLNSGKISQTWKIDTAQFLNDIVANPEKNSLFISDSNTDVIYRFTNNEIQAWADSGFSGPNGLSIYSDKLYLATNKGNKFVSIDMQTKEIKEIVSGIGAGDGVEYTGTGNNFLVSNWEGEIFIVRGEDSKTRILNTKDQDINSADIEFIKDRNLLLVPTFFDNRVVAYNVSM